ncbi:hypothetical protein BDN71DRAFT_1518737 [Pleurotus eryngii]|uniref:Uncharacterized protein n=1 Tax=Pleurotus eryngii TaxID=5323 RepID=A0A9P5ZR81_PLEER|nr:hypothetical protein BDN71DRAFT_1518737 [Pleurotus eryngii]
MPRSLRHPTATSCQASSVFTVACGLHVSYSLSFPSAPDTAQPVLGRNIVGGIIPHHNRIVRGDGVTGLNALLSFGVWTSESRRLGCSAPMRFTVRATQKTLDDVDEVGTSTLHSIPSLHVLEFLGETFANCGAWSRTLATCAFCSRRSRRSTVTKLVDLGMMSRRTGRKLAGIIDATTCLEFLPYTTRTAGQVTSGYSVNFARSRRLPALSEVRARREQGGFSGIKRLELKSIIPIIRAFRHPWMEWMGGEAHIGSQKCMDRSREPHSTPCAGVKLLLKRSTWRITTCTPRSYAQLPEYPPPYYYYDHILSDHHSYSPLSQLPTRRKMPESPCSYHSSNEAIYVRVRRGLRGSRLALPSMLTTEQAGESPLVGHRVGWVKHWRLCEACGIYPASHCFPWKPPTFVRNGSTPARAPKLSKYQLAVASTTRRSRAAGRGRLDVPLLEVHRAQPLSPDPGTSILVDCMKTRRTRAGVRALRTLLDDDAERSVLEDNSSERRRGSLPTLDQAWVLATTMQHFLCSPSCNNLGLIVSLRHLHQKGLSSPLFVVSNSHSPSGGGMAVSSPQSLAYLAACDLAPSTSRLGTYRNTSVNMWRNVSSPLLSASPWQLPSDGPVLASRRNNQPSKQPAVEITSRSRIHAVAPSFSQSCDPSPQQLTERISSFTAMFPPPSTPIPRPNSDIELRSLVPCCALPMDQYRRTVIGWSDSAVDQKRHRRTPRPQPPALDLRASKHVDRQRRDGLQPAGHKRIVVPIETSIPTHQASLLRVLK